MLRIEPKVQVSRIESRDETSGTTEV